MAFTGRESHGNRSRPGTDRDRRSRDQPSLARRIVRATSARWRLAYTVASRRLRRGLAYAPLNLAPHGSCLSIIQEAQRPGPSWLLQRRSRWPPVYGPVGLPAKRFKRPGGSRAHARVRFLERGHKGLHGAGVADLAKPPGGSLAHPVVPAFEGADEGFDGARVADLAECLGGSFAHLRGLVFEGGDEGFDGAGVADLAECLGGSPAHAPACL